ncbi:MAG TPA: peptidase T [Candidatus Deferrimicrobium sp.]|nr:peptidase T [Candidatus Deferrimicrobium sp.]
MSKVVERFLRYVQFDTKSNENSQTVPSTPGQMVFAQALAKELTELGLQEVNLDHNGYLFATLPANGVTSGPTLGLIAHLDTSPDMPGAQVKPQVIENYSGGDITLNQDKGIVLSPKDFPELAEYKGKTLITTDGTTLLGADDKAGIAEIISAVEYLLLNPEIIHGKIRLAFTPDEEVGRGADHFDVQKFGANLAYTVDGGPLGELEYENFNAAKATIAIQGRNVHPGTAKGKMINSQLLAAEFIALLPPAETPAHTEGYEGFYHLTEMQGEVEQTVLQYIIRDFDSEAFSQRKSNILGYGQALNAKYGQGICSVEIKDQYLNMKEKIEPVKYIVETAFKAMQEVGVTPLVNPIRGGTDGARLSFMGLPTPNIFTGGHNFHGKYEFIPAFAMEKAVEVILQIVKLYAKG